MGVTLYAVFREGIYRHECGGVFDSVINAEQAREVLIGWDIDSYHEYTIVPFVLNEITKRGDYAGVLLEHDELSRASKPK